MEEIFRHLGQCLEQQLQVWPAAKEAFSNLEQVQTRVLSSSGLALQHNPARIISTTAKVKPAETAARSCFLCSENRPVEQIAFDAGDGFDLLLNPYPILREHFCVVSREHRPQMFRDCYELKEMTFTGNTRISTPARWWKSGDTSPPDGFTAN